jgi:anti-sigma regulatory factor (Ser/Thr protein kinase)
MLLELALPSSPDAPGTARRSLRALASRLSPSLLANIELVVSELVTNSLRHARAAGRAEIRLRLASTRGGVRGEVIDRGAGFERTPRAPSMYQESGWGLYLVDQLSERWGVERGPATTVWFELKDPEQT